jgi:predicted tellurium resistance membrane protein TerC
VANFKKRKETDSNLILTLIAMIGLFIAGVLIIAFELLHAPEQVVSMAAVFAILTGGALIWSRQHRDVNTTTKHH